jgi:hypothetical protein
MGSYRLDGSKGLGIASDISLVYPFGRVANGLHCDRLR